MNTLVALPIVAAMPTTAPAMPPGADLSADPIFPAIDAYRKADAACIAVNGDIPDDMGERWDEAISVVMRTHPTTPAGLAALTSWARERADWLRANGTEGGGNFCTVSATIDDAARGMSGLEPWSPTAHAEDPIYAAIADCLAKKRASYARYAQVARASRKAKESGLNSVSSLADRNMFVAKEIGCDPDAYTTETASAWWKSLDALCRTKPTTVPGVLALLQALKKVTAGDSDLVQENAVPLVKTLIAALSNMAAPSR